MWGRKLENFKFCAAFYGVEKLIQSPSKFVRSISYIPQVLRIFFLFTVGVKQEDDTKVISREA